MLLGVTLSISFHAGCCIHCISKHTVARQLGAHHTSNNRTYSGNRKCHTVQEMTSTGKY